MRSEAQGRDEKHCDGERAHFVSLSEYGKPHRQLLSTGEGGDKCNGDVSPIKAGQFACVDDCYALEQGKPEGI